MPQEIEVKLKETIRRNYNVKSFRFEVPGEVNFQAGQFVSITLQNNPALKRYLSISSSPTEKCYIEFTKKITQSEFSKVLDVLRPGESVKIQYPLGKFVLDDVSKKIAFLSGGIGITPIRSICKCAVDKSLDIDMVLVYSNRSVRDIIFKEDFDFMQRVYPKLKVSHVLCETDPGFKCTVGLINATVIKNEIPDYKERKFYLCGPPQMVSAMEKILSEELSLPKAQVVTENFQGY